MDRITFIPGRPLFLATIFCLQIYVNAFNLDSRIPIIKRAERGAYFGYSVAEHQVEFTVGKTHIGPFYFKRISVFERFDYNYYCIYFTTAF